MELRGEAMGLELITEIFGEAFLGMIAGGAAIAMFTVLLQYAAVF